MSATASLAAVSPRWCLQTPNLSLATSTVALARAPVRQAGVRAAESSAGSRLARPMRVAGTLHSTLVAVVFLLSNWSNGTHRARSTS